MIGTHLSRHKNSVIRISLASILVISTSTPSIQAFDILATPDAKSAIIGAASVCAASILALRAFRTKSHASTPTPEYTQKNISDHELLETSNNRQRYVEQNPQAGELRTLRRYSLPA